MSLLPAQETVQTSFLSYLKDKSETVTVFLVNGVKLQGIIAGFDGDSVLLRRDGHVQLVYKHAISTIMPVTALPDFAVALRANPAAGAL